MAKPLIEAIQKGDAQQAKKILQSKNYTCIDSQTSKRNGTALFWASCRGLVDTAQILIAHNANVNSTTAWGSTPLHAAADSNNCQIIKLLLKHGAKVNSQTQNGDTPCHLAAYRGHAQAVQLLVEDGADVGIPNNRHRLPVHEALQQSHSEVADYLQAVSLLVKEKIQSPITNYSNAHQFFLADRKCMNYDIRDSSLDFKMDSCDSLIDIPEVSIDSVDSVCVGSEIRCTSESTSSASSTSLDWDSSLPLSSDYISRNNLSLTSERLNSSVQWTFRNIAV